MDGWVVELNHGSVTFVVNAWVMLLVLYSRSIQLELAFTKVQFPTSTCLTDFPPQFSVSCTSHGFKLKEDVESDLNRSGWCCTNSFDSSVSSHGTAKTSASAPSVFNQIAFNNWVRDASYSHGVHTAQQNDSENSSSLDT